ncbi:MAG: NUDIX domain-containing protein [Bacilli bacterium]|nr:NUDIX domain-containing protein [Bacilli bacterium]
MKDVSIMIEDVKFNLRAGLMIECEDEILVEVNPEIDFVTLPGGRIKTMESAKEGLQREIYEELKYTVKDEECTLRGIIENFFEYENKKYHEIYFLYKIKIDKNHILYNDSLVNQDSTNHYYKWVKKNNLTEENLLPEIVRTWAKTDGFDSAVLK